MFTDTINVNELKMNIIKNNLEMHFDKFNLRSFWSHLMNFNKLLSFTQSLQHDN